jgi:hypothetical protein
MVNGVIYKKTGDLDTIWKDAMEACKAGAVHNLVLSYEFDIGVTDSEFVKLHEGQAEAWQSEQPVRNFHFSHGQYFKGKRGMEYVINELKSKSASRRALLSLIDMDDIVGRGDKAIPSFMVAQFGHAGDVLYVTEYFRALEVGSFLPINLAEMSLMVRGILCGGLARPGIVRLLLIAFQAHLTPHFRLEKAELDVVSAGEIGAAVATRDFKTMLAWLEDKKDRYESEVLTHGLEEMVAIVRKYSAHYPDPFLSALRQSVKSLKEVRDLRASHSDERIAENQHRKYVEQLESAIRELKGARERHFEKLRDLPGFRTGDS